jgi:predicted nuclease with TOPRIM domain
LVRGGFFTSKETKMNANQINQEMRRTNIHLKNQLTQVQRFGQIMFDLIDAKKTSRFDDVMDRLTNYTAMCNTQIARLEEKLDKLEKELDELSTEEPSTEKIEKCSNGQDEPCDCAMH